MYNGNGFDLFGSCLGGLCFLAIFILTLVAMFWVYQDAEKRGKTGCLWLLLISALLPYTSQRNLRAGSSKSPGSVR
jgi:di/tricarboxylate transporter